jgi:hypothetical protein
MTAAKRTTEPIEVFLSYSHKDEDLRNELVKHLSALKRSGVITDWHDRKITPGSEWAGEIDSHLNSAKVMLRAVDWKDSPFAKLQALPNEARPITSWSNKDEAFTDVAQGIRKAVAEITASSQPKTTSKTKATPSAAKPSNRETSSAPTKSRPKAKEGSAPEAPKQRRTTSTTERPDPKPYRPTPSKAVKSNRTPVAESPSNNTETVQHLRSAFADRPKANTGVVWMQVVWASRRTDAAIKPTQFTEEAFVRRIQALAHDGKHPLFAFGAPNQTDANTSRLKIVQHESTRGVSGGQDLVELSLFANGTVSVALNVTNLKGQGQRDFFASMRINLDDVQKRLEQAWSFTARWWDSYLGARAQRLMSFVYNVGLFDTENCQFERPPQGVYTNTLTSSMRSRPNPLLAYDAPKNIGRSLVVNRGGEIRDVVKLLQMRFNES